MLSTGGFRSVADRWVSEGGVVRYRICSVEAGRLEEGALGVHAHWNSVPRSRIKRRHRLRISDGVVSR